MTTSDSDFPRSIAELKQSLQAGEGRGFTTLGLLVLITTPIVRVAVSALAFLVERDRVFVAITLTVLVLLIASLFLGKASG